MHHRQRFSTVPFATFVAVALATASATAQQCSLRFLAGMGIPGVYGGAAGEVVLAMTTWDRDGTGPLHALVVIAGRFTEAGTVRTGNIAAYDPATGHWSALGSGTNDQVLALAVAQNGDLIAGGQFTAAGGVTANRVARWDGTTWSPLGTGVDAAVSALAVMPNGDVVAGGGFTTAGGIAANYIARWDGISWFPLGAGTGSGVYALTVLPSGDLIAGGAFTTAGGIAAPCVARWDGISWSPMIATIINSTSSPSVRAIALTPNGDMVAAGQFTSIDGVACANIARWSAGWSPLGAGVPPLVESLAVLPNGDVVACGFFASIRIWNGTAWSQLASNVVVRAVAGLPSGDVVAGGAFTAIGGVPAMAVALWNGVSWAALAAGSGSAALGGANAPVHATVAMPNGDLVAAGSFTTIAGIAVERIARWDGTTWWPLGAGIGIPSPFGGSGGAVMALAVMPNGDVVAGGNFTTAGGVPATHVARWDGVNWSPLGSGPGLPITALQVLPNGDLVAGSSNPSTGNLLWRWNGTAWSPMATTTAGWVRALDLFPNGDLLLAGFFSSVGGVAANNIARWNGVTWSALGSGTTGQLYAAKAMPDGSVVAAAPPSASGPLVNGIARWDGVAWSPLGSGMSGIMALLPLPDGDLLAGGSFTAAGGVPASRLARWNGAAWAAFGSGCDGDVTGLAAMPNGDVVVRGAFLTTGDATSARLTRVTTTCPATVVGLGAGCTGSGGANVLTATTLPWTGSTFRAVATGMPAQALVLSVYGFTPVSVPIAAVLPQGLPGCSLHTLPAFIDVLLPAAGVVQTQLALPDTVALAGLVLHHFVAPFELGASGQVVAISSSNALTLKLGSF